MSTPSDPGQPFHPTDIQPRHMWEGDEHIIPPTAPGTISIEGFVADVPDVMTVMINRGTLHGVQAGMMIRVLEPAREIRDPENNQTPSILLQRNMGFFQIGIARRNFSYGNLVQITSRTAQIQVGYPCIVEQPAIAPDTRKLRPM